ncbi:MAG: hypothetical protein KDD65_18735, partial [Bacteroidetes bacterium]|nr:hypothetical protein [Bacteroidota bacterium]
MLRFIRPARAFASVALALFASGTPALSQTWVKTVEINPFHVTAFQPTGSGGFSFGTELYGLCYQRTPSEEEIACGEWNTYATVGAAIGYKVIYQSRPHGGVWKKPGGGFQYPSPMNPVGDSEIPQASFVLPDSAILGAFDGYGVMIESGWEWIPYGTWAHSGVFVNSFVRTDSGELLVGTNKGVFIYDAIADTWLSHDLEGVDIRLLYADETLYAEVDGTLVQRVDSGEWIPILEMRVNAVARMGGSLFAATDYGLFGKMSSDSDWKLLGLERARVLGVANFGEASVLAVTASSGLFTVGLDLVPMEFERRVGGEILGMQIAPDGAVWACVGTADTYNRARFRADNFEGHSFYAGLRDCRSLVFGADGSTFAFTEGSSLLRSLDKGRNWAATGIGPTRSVAALRNSDVVVAVDTSGTIRVSTDLGVSWSSDAPGVAAQFDATRAAASGDTLLVSGDGGVYRSADHGNSWQLVFEPAEVPTGISVPAPGTIFVKTPTHTKYLSEDGGATWETLSFVCHDCLMVKSGSNETFIQTDFPRRMSSDRGATWQSIGLERHPPIRNLTVLDDGRLAAVFKTDPYGGYIYTTTEPIFVSAEEDAVDDIASSVRAFPNPADNRVDIEMGSG